MLLSDTTLNFWSSFATDTVIERRHLMNLVEPHFNQLTLFDPRIPHGVREVHGTREPTQSRIVLHGWFVEPGALPATVSIKLVVRAAGGTWSNPRTRPSGARAPSDSKRQLPTTLCTNSKPSCARTPDPRPRGYCNALEQRCGPSKPLPAQLSRPRAPPRQF